MKLTGKTMRHTFHTPLLLMMFALLGCEDPAVRSYAVPKDQPTPHMALTAAQPQPQQPPVQQTGEPAQLVWQLPAGWHQRADPGAMRVATLLTGEADDAMEIAITRFPGSVGGLLANVNRWREQIGLPPTDEEGLRDVLEVFDVGQLRVIWLDMTGTTAVGATAPQRTVVAVLFDGQFSWFIKMMDAADRVEPLLGDFQNFIASCRFVGNEAAASPVQPVAPPAQQASPITAAPPAGWTRGPARTMVLAVWAVEGGAEATISSFPGDVGGTLANIARWRAQLSAPPITSLDEQPAGEVTIAGQPGKRYEIRGPAQAMLVAMQTRGGSTWFYKFMGPANVIDANKNAFDQWLDSITISE